MVPFTVREYIDVFKEDIVRDALLYHKMAPKGVEIDDFKLFSELLVSEMKNDKDIDGWYLGTDLKVVADFDVLWFGKNTIFNIDLKHERIDSFEDRISNKFNQQEKMLNLVGEYKILSIVFIASEQKLLLFQDSILKEINFGYLVEEIQKQMPSEPSSNIVAEMDPAKYMIAPLTDMEKFLHGKYWLNPEQNTIIKLCDKQNGLFAVEGEAGSGKSLVAYDLARRFDSKKMFYLFFQVLYDQLIKL